jgi:hypothetical protein
MEGAPPDTRPITGNAKPAAIPIFNKLLKYTSTQNFVED